MNKREFVCNKCGKRVPDDTMLPWCECGGLWDLAAENNGDGFPGEGMRLSSISLGETQTPVVEIKDGLFLKMDYYMPTLSFKDRGAASLISHCKDIGVKRVIEDSSGNAGNSIAAYCARAGIDCEIYVPEGTSAGKVKLISAYGAKVTVTPGSRDECARLCREKVEKEKIYYASHVCNPYFIEGVKSYIYEAVKQLKKLPDAVFSPVGNGTLLLGIIKGLEEMMESGTVTRMPKIVAVQSMNCAPIYKAYIEGKDEPVKIDPRPTLAEGIAIGEPRRGRQIIEKIKMHDIDVIAVTEDEIERAMKELLCEGIFCEETSAATYAAYVKYNNEHPECGDSLITMCGSGMKTMRV